MILGLNEVGGWNQLFVDYPCSAPNITNGFSSCAYPPETYANIIRPADDPNFPWPGVMFGMIIGSIWYWCTDQMIVQITLSARDLSNAKLGCVGAALLKIFPVFLMVIPGFVHLNLIIQRLIETLGMISRTLWPNDIACQTAEECLRACGAESGCTNVAYPTLVMRILPNGLKVNFRSNRGQIWIIIFRVCYLP